MEFEGPRVEPELVAVPEPPRHRRSELPGQGLPYIEEDDPRSAEQPFQSAGRQEVDAGVPHIQWHLPHRLVGVDQTERALGVGGGGDRRDVLDRAAGEVHVRGRDQRRALIDRAGDRVDRHRHLVRALHHDDLDPAALLGEPLIGDRRKVEGGENDLRALAIVERLGHRAHGDGDTGSQRDLPRIRADDRAIAAPQVRQRLPPHVVPGGGPACLPLIQEFRYFAARAIAQGAQGAGVQVDAVAEDRELAAVARQRLGRRARSGEPPLPPACE